MIADYEDDAHFCLKCHITIIGLNNYVNHRKAGCSKNLSEPPKSPLPSQLLPPDESFNLKADDFFSSLELRSSSKKIETQSTSGKNFSGILTRSKTTAVIQATSQTNTVLGKETNEPQQSKSGKNVWIGGHQLKELGQGDNQSKLIKAVANLERRKEEPTRFDAYDDSDEDSEEYDYDEDESSSDDQDVPPKNYTGGKWKPSSPIEWTRSSDTRDWNIPPPSHTGGKWKPYPKRSSSPANHTKGKWKPSCSRDDDNIPPSTFTGSKWVSTKKQENVDIPPPTFTGSKWISSKKHDYHDAPPPATVKGKWKTRPDEEELSLPPSDPKGKWKSKNPAIDVIPPPDYTKGKWKPEVENADNSPPASTSKEKYKSKPITENVHPQSSTRLQPNFSNDHKKTHDEKTNIGMSAPEGTYTKGKWLPPTHSKKNPKIDDISLLRKSNGAIQYWCSPCNRRLASKIVYERHLKSELHFKRTSHDREFDDNEPIVLMKESRRAKLKRPEPIVIAENKSSKVTSEKKRIRKKIYERCVVCHSKVNKFLIGKHLISHYHCRRGDITSEVARRMVLENIHGVILESPFQCSICKFYCNTQEDFLRHWSSADHVEKVAPGYFFCILCKYRNEDNRMMYKHLVSSEHMEVVSVINRSVPIVIKKVNPINCLTCNEEFLLNMQLISHCKKFNHDDSVVKKFRNEFVCNTCGVGLLSNVSLKRHKQIVHKEKYFICTPCNLKFSDVNEARKHRKSVQHKYNNINKGNDASLTKKCEYCKECFANFLLLKEHLQKSHPEHKIRCPHCGANFTIAQELTTHLRLKSCKFEDNSENSLRCEKCPFSSNSTSELIFHVALHDEPLLTYSSDTGTDSKNKPTPRYKCPVCDKLYPRASLHAHIRQHTHERPYVCNICNKAFARKNNLQFHIKNHSRKSSVKPVSGDRTFLCSVCGANFKKK
ncbi:hypothetical protein JTB14_005599 [Gonioctena quinquepunctata]|nr:hypothetical protein JTB14_005599 [Gonioctena quinquepunctata]